MQTTNNNIAKQKEFESKQCKTSNETKQQQNNNYDYNYDDQSNGYYNTNDYDEYQEWNDFDEADFDPQSKKIRVTTYSSDKKIKHKKDPSVQTYQQTMKMVNRIHRKSRNKQKRNNNLYGVIVVNGKELYLGTICGNHMRMRINAICFQSEFRKPSKR
eukprot:150575_1